FRLVALLVVLAPGRVTAIAAVSEERPGLLAHYSDLPGGKTIVPAEARTDRCRQAIHGAIRSTKRFVNDHRDMRHHDIGVHHQEGGSLRQDLPLRLFLRGDKAWDIDKGNHGQMISIG